MWIVLIQLPNKDSRMLCHITHSPPKTIQSISSMPMLQTINYRINWFVYVFQVPYYNFTQVFAEAEKQQKPVHSILLWGALDDQSCWGSARTLRETALECPRVMSLLAEHFVSSWFLVVDLKVRKFWRCYGLIQWSYIVSVYYNCYRYISLIH